MLEAQSGIALTPATIAVTVTLVINLSALVWGAASMSAAVKTLSTNFAGLQESIAELVKEVSGLTTRIAITEDRMAREGLLERRESDYERRHAQAQ